MATTFRACLGFTPKSPDGNVWMCKGPTRPGQQPLHGDGTAYEHGPDGVAPKGIRNYNPDSRVYGLAIVTPESDRNSLPEVSIEPAAKEFWSADARPEDVCFILYHRDQLTIPVAKLPPNVTARRLMYKVLAPWGAQPRVGYLYYDRGVVRVAFEALTDWSAVDGLLLEGLVWINMATNKYMAVGATEFADPNVRECIAQHLRL